MKRTWLSLPVLALTAACSGSDGNTTPDAGTGNNALAACTAVVDEKLSRLSDQLAAYPIADLATMSAADATAKGLSPASSLYKGHYRELANGHPGCTPRAAYTGKLYLNAKNEATVAPGIPVQGTDATKPGYVKDYGCAAKEYDMPAGVAVDTTKPVVVLVHGNSSSPNSWEEFTDPTKAGTEITNLGQFKFTVDATPREMLAARLTKAGYRVIAVDLRTDVVYLQQDAVATAPGTDPKFGDAAGNVDHGWSVPIVQALVKGLIVGNPNQQIALVGHSLGYTVIQDTLRRLFNEYKAGTLATNPLTKINTVVLASGAAHGVASGKKNCDFYTTMRGSVNCEMGDRDAWQATPFNKLLNGPEDLFSTPCADGSFAYGKKEQCGGHAVKYATVTMKDPEGTKLQDEFVSEASSRLGMDKVQVDANGKKTVVDPACVDNHLIELTDFDSSSFFMDGLPGFLANHFGSIRSENGQKFILSTLAK